MSELCEWDPENDRPAQYENANNGDHLGCQNPAVIVTGKRHVWHLCESCARLPRFTRLSKLYRGPR